ncbi:MAG: DUF234 domain-containing protein [Clostridia bacterium]|nr:DUF234 domain-containing protein [Clostridia bacterium]
MSTLGTIKGITPNQSGNSLTLQESFYLLFQLYSNNLIIVLDRYNNLQQALPEIDQLLKKGIENCFGRDKYVILCDDDTKLMNRLCSKGGPFERLSAAPIQIKAMDYADAALFYPDYSPADRIRMYAAFGGMPDVLRLIDGKAPVRENIIRQFVGTDTIIGRMIRELVNDIGSLANVNSILCAMAEGAESFADILAKSHLSSAPALVDLLNKMLEAGIIRKEMPVNDPNNRRRARYSIASPAVAFWFRYIFPNQSLLWSMTSDDFYDRYIADDFEKNYLSKVFSEVCKQYLHRLYKVNEANKSLHIGRHSYYDRHAKVMHDVPLVVMEDDESAAYLPVSSELPLTNADMRKSCGLMKKLICTVVNTISSPSVAFQTRNRHSVPSES